MDSTVIPLLPGPWRPLAPERAAGFDARLRRLLQQPLSHAALQPDHPVSGLRAMPLSFYPGWVLIEGEATVGPELIGTFDVLYGPGLMWLIDGESRLLNDLNAGRIPVELADYADGSISEGMQLASPLTELDPAVRGPEFIRFYCGCVWGEEGPFMPLESIASPLLRGLNLDDQPWLDQIRPIKASRDGDALLAEGLIAYGQSIFQARLCVQGASVTMEDDTPIAVDVLPLRSHSAPLRDLRNPRDGASDPRPQAPRA